MFISSVSSQMNSGSLYFYRNLFNLNCQIYGSKFLIFSYPPFNTSRMYSKFFTFVSDTVICAFFFSCSVWLEVYQFYCFDFKGPIFGFIDFSIALDFYFCFTFSSLLLALGLICPSFSSFQRWKLRSLILKKIFSFQI